MKNFNNFINENNKDIDCNPEIIGNDIELDMDNLKKCMKSSKFDIEERYGDNNNPKNGYTLLFYAANWTHIDLLKLLIDNGADVNTEFNDKNAFVQLLTKITFTTKTTEILDMLIENGIDLSFLWGEVDVFDIMRDGNEGMRLYAKEIPKKFPEQYKEYLVNKDLKKFNI